MVANYGPRTTAFVTLDDGVYEFTLGVNGIDGWLCSRERVQIKRQSKIFSPAVSRRWKLECRARQQQMAEPQICPAPCSHVVRARCRHRTCARRGTSCRAMAG